ncbi:MAG: Asp23/Gls24 family envelope stress response protein [Actinomycetes bacterium]|nr:Asp23/Gls24 family envelope stress response protein [Actinomycetes bacterium]
MMPTDGKTQGSIHIANEVLADLAGYAALESYGVVGMASPSLRDGLVQLLPARKLRRGVHITTVDGTHSPSSDTDGGVESPDPASDVTSLRPAVEVDLYVVIEYGTQLAEVSRNLADRVRYVLTSQAEVAVARVDVHVLDIKVRPRERAGAGA